MQALPRARSRPNIIRGAWRGKNVEDWSKGRVGVDDGDDGVLDKDENEDSESNDDDYGDVALTRLYTSFVFYVRLVPVEANGDGAKDIWLTNRKIVFPLRPNDDSNGDGAKDTCHLAVCQRMQ